MQHRISALHAEESPFTNSLNTPSDEPATRELTLGTATILGLFFALALVCAVFFGFGYSLGSHHSVPAVSTAAAAVAPPAFNAVKPSPGSPAAAPTPTAHETPAETVTVPVASPAAHVTSTAAEPGNLPAEPTPDPRPVLVGAAQPIVQVAAVSHQEDAELIASTLKRRGYAVAIRSEPQDKLLHLQVGPFPTKKDAEAMRQRLLADGFNAYIK